MAPSPSLQFADQFKEVKEAARLSREKSQERFELANPGLNIAAPEVKRSAFPSCWKFGSFVVRDNLEKNKIKTIFT